MVGRVSSSLTPKILRNVRILRQRHPYTLGNEEASLEIQPRAWENVSHKKSPAHPIGSTRTSGRSGLTYLPSHHPTCYLHEAYKTFPVRLRHWKAVESFGTLELLLTPFLMESMTCNTNTYAALKTSERLQEGGRKWKEVSTLELGMIFG